MLPAEVAAQGAGAVVTDFSPLRVSLGWVRDVGKALAVPLYQVRSLHLTRTCNGVTRHSPAGGRTQRDSVLEGVAQAGDSGAHVPTTCDRSPSVLSHRCVLTRAVFVTRIEFPLVEKHPFGVACKPATDWDAANAS